MLRRPGSTASAEYDDRAEWGCPALKPNFAISVLDHVSESNHPDETLQEAIRTAGPRPPTACQLLQEQSTEAPTCLGDAQRAVDCGGHPRKWVSRPPPRFKKKSPAFIGFMSYSSTGDFI